MLSWVREKFGPLMIGLIVGLIAFVFIFSGVFNPSKTRGLHEGAVAGTVNGESIGLSEFNRALNQRIEFYRNLSGGKITEAQIKQARLRESVFQELVQMKLLAQAARKAGIEGSDEAVKDRIAAMDVFKKEGRFDPVAYKMVLKANNLTPQGFEKLIREELSQSEWQKFFKARVKVAESEIQAEFQVSQDKRNLKYVLLTSDVGARAVKVAAAEVETFLKDAANANTAKAQFEVKKNSEFKGKTFEQVRSQIAEKIIASRKPDEVRKASERLADEILPKLQAAKSSDAAVNAALKAYGVEVKSTGMVTRGSPYLPGIGEAKDLMKDAFASPSPIDPAQGGKAKKYVSGGWVLVAVVTESKHPLAKDYEKERETILGQVRSKKERDLFETWMKGLKEKAKVVANPAVINEESGG